MPLPGPNVVHGVALPAEDSANALIFVLAPLATYTAGWIAGAMLYVRVTVTDAGVLAESVTWNTVGNVPPAVGVPEIPPVNRFKVSPGGSLPEATDQVSGAKPPNARVCSDRGRRRSASRSTWSAHRCRAAR